MLGEMVDRILTWGTAGFVFAKPLLEKIWKNPELAKEATKRILEVNTRTRVDEQIFFASLTSLSGPDATEENKILFYQKYCELDNPDLTTGTPAQIEERKEKRELAKGLVFLIAEDNVFDRTTQRFNLATQVWHGIFMGISKLPNDNAKLAEFEKRILLFGKNHQERMTLKEVIKFSLPHAKAAWAKIDSAADSVGDGIGKVTDWINDQYDKKENRAIARRAKVAANKWHRINPLLWFEWFCDQF